MMNAALLMQFVRLVFRKLSGLFAALLVVFACSPAGAAGEQGGGWAAGQATCYGRYVNPITDLCWECIFPISIGGYSYSGGQEDIENPSDPICYCPISFPPYYRVGLEVGFWEPSRLIESTRTPFCFPALGGYYMNNSSYKPPGGRAFNGHDKVVRDSFYQVHMYINPVLYYLELIVDEQCVEVGSYDLSYMSEYDSEWHSDELTAIIEPEAPLFANIVAIAACSADCVAASIGFGLKELFWCSGCNGPVYPMNGNVSVHVGGVQASTMLVHRTLAKMHRLMIAWQWWGAGAVCQGHPAPLMDKRGYKTQMVYPIAETGGTDGTGYRCCHPLGRTTQIWGMGREYPIKGEDFAYQIFRKRNCCMY
jgi:conjugal transfer pilus assembly protein TraU